MEADRRPEAGRPFHVDFDRAVRERQALQDGFGPRRQPGDLDRLHAAVLDDLDALAERPAIRRERDGGRVRRAGGAGRRGKHDGRSVGDEEGGEPPGDVGHGRSIAPDRTAADRNDSSRLGAAAADRLVGVLPTTSRRLGSRMGRYLSRSGGCSRATPFKADSYGDDDSAAGFWCVTPRVRILDGPLRQARCGRWRRHAHLLHRRRRSGVGLRAERRQRRRGPAVQRVREAVDGGRAARRRPQGEEGALPRVHRTRRSRPSSRAPAEWEHLGFLGPLVRAEVGDTIKIVFRNNAKFAAAVHPHGVFYNKDSEGANYNDGSTGGDKADDAVPTGGTHTYTWEVPERAGPTAHEGSSAFWMYHSHNDEIRDVASGLIGPMIVTRKGMARPTDRRPTSIASWSPASSRSTRTTAGTSRRTSRRTRPNPKGTWIDRRSLRRHDGRARARASPARPSRRPIRPPSPGPTARGSRRPSTATPTATPRG